MRYARRTILAVLDDVKAGASISSSSAKYGVSSATIKRWLARHGCTDRSRLDLLLRYENIQNLPSVESQAVEWIGLMVENDRLYSGKELPHNLWLKWKGFEVYFRWARRREIAGRKVLSLELANIRIPKQFQGRGWFRTFVALLKRISPTDGIVIEEASNTRNFWMRGTLTSWGFKELFEDNYWFGLAVSDRQQITLSGAQKTPAGTVE